MSFPETFGALWIDVRTFESGRRYAEKVFDVFRVKQVIDQLAYNQLKKDLNNNAILFPYQVFDLILKQSKR